MTACADSSTMQRLSRRVEFETGLIFVNERLEDLERRLRPLVSEFGFTSSDECFSKLANGAWSEVQRLEIVDALTIGETYFFRDPHVWRMLKEELIPELLNKLNTGAKQKISLWSAACSTGEEAYSMALTCYEVSNSLSKSFVSCVGSDLNRRSIEKAREGRYSNWALRSMEKQVRERYFTKSNTGDYILCSPIRSMVQFRNHNLIPATNHPAPGTEKFDIIFCRNVLMYFETKKAMSVIEHLAASLHEGGWLVLSPCDVHLAPEHLERITKPGVIALRAPSPDRAKVESTSLSLGLVPPALSTSHSTNASLITSSAINQPGDTTSNDQTFEKANSLMSEGKWQEAASLLVHMIDSGDMRAELATAAARCFVNDKQPTVAVNYLNKSLSVNPLNRTLYFLKGNILADQGNYEGAIKALRQAIFVDSEYIMAHFVLFGLLKQSDPSKASLHVQQAEKSLSTMNDQEIVPDADGMCVKQLKQIIATLGETNGAD